MFGVFEYIPFVLISFLALRESGERARLKHPLSNKMIELIMLQKKKKTVVINTFFKFFKNSIFI
jgi:hypothetical protein